MPTPQMETVTKGTLRLFLASETLICPKNVGDYAPDFWFISTSQEKLRFRECV